MEHIAAFMMLVGCTGGDTACRELPAPAVGFETVRECEDLLRPSVKKAAAESGIVYGKCVSVDPALFLDDATISWEITADRKLEVRVEFDREEQIAFAPPAEIGKAARTVN